MKYTIDVAADSIWTTHRLKKDRTFKTFTGKHEKVILEDDFTFDDYYEAKHWMSNHNFIEVEGEKIEVNPTVSGLTDPVASIRPHRISKPKQAYFSKEQLRKVLLSGNDNINNSLVVDFDGYLHLVPFKQAKEGPYAVRFETFVAGNGYVGEESNLYHLEDTYLGLLDSWSIHLVSHDMEYREHPCDQSKEELIKEIKEAIENL
jgi:hypothetical protein